MRASAADPAQPGDEVYQTGFLFVEEARRSIELPEGYGLELVLSEPRIEEPVALAFDGDGAMYVVEMRTYMQNIDARGEKEPTSRISRHEDTDGDGTFDRGTVFIDNLLLPRMVLPLDDRVLVGVTDTLDLWTYRDTDGDGVADEKILVYEGGRRGGNMEHQPSGLIWGLDNWIYITYEAVRYRFKDGRIEKESLPRGGGQWGLTQDDSGRIYYSTGGGENPAFFFQQPPCYGMVAAPGETEPGFRTVYPIAPVPDVQGGRRRVGPNGGLNAFTGCAGQGIFRGDRLPEDMRGDLLIPEPVGRLIRRAKVEREDGRTVLSNAHPGSEFIRSRDVNFRPLGAETAPDGRMFLIDMHRGIIQQGNWVRPGSYLRGVVQKWKLDENIGKGRIYRLVHRDFGPDKQPRMLSESTADLVRHLSHPNGWWRNTAQKLIVLREDAASVVPALEELARDGGSELGRVHALWTLEGIDAARPDLVAEAMGDPSSEVRVAAVRVGESHLRGGDETVIDALSKLAADPSADVAIQVLNSIAFTALDHPSVPALEAALFEKHGDLESLRALQRSRTAVAEQRARIEAQRKRDAAFAQQLERGDVVYKQLCFACHGADGTGTPMEGVADQTLAPSLVKSPRVLGSGGSLVRTLLHGRMGGQDGKTYPGQMLPLASNDDAWIADIATYVRNNFGNNGGAISPEFVARIREESAGRIVPWTEAELDALEPPMLTNRKEWKLRASHGGGSLRNAVDGRRDSRWDTGTAQVPGMWFEVEFPRASRINRVVLDSAKSSRDFPRGYELRLSMDGTTWGDPVASGAGRNPTTDIGLPLSETRFLRITQTGSAPGLYWSIHEIQIFGKESR